MLRRNLLISSWIFLVAPCGLYADELTAILFTLDLLKNGGILVVVLYF